MKFNLFVLMVLAIRDINFTALCVRPAFFHESRRKWLKVEHNKIIRYLEPQRQVRVSDGSETLPPRLFGFIAGRYRGLREAIQFLIEFNGRNIITLVTPLQHLLLLTLIVVRIFAYTYLSTCQDPVTGDYINPILRFLHMIHLRKSSEVEFNNLQNMVNGCIVAQHLVLRSRLIIEQVSLASQRSINYNTVIASFSYLAALKASPKGWMRFIVYCWNHKCDYSSPESRLDELELRRLWRHTRRLHPVDKIRYNLISFDKCYDDSLVSINDKCRERRNYHIHYFTEVRANENTIQVPKLATTNEHGQEIINLGLKTGLFARYLRKIKTLAINTDPQQDLERYFIQIPHHRMCPSHFKFALMLYLLYVVILSVSVVLLTSLVWIIELKRFGLDLNNITLYLAATCFLESVSNYTGFFMLFDISVMFSIICVNITDNGLIIFCTLIAYSRAWRVERLLSGPVDFLMYHRSTFSNFLLMQQFSRQFSATATTTTTTRQTTNQVGSKRLSSEPMKSKSCGQRARANQATGGIGNQGPKHAFDMDSDDWLGQQADKMKALYRLTIAESSVEDFNENIEYLIDLVGVLHVEFIEQRHFFTSFINLNISIGTVSVAGMIALIAKTEPIPIYRSLQYSMLIMTLSPLLFSLLMGAIAELSSRRICQILMTLMVDDLNLVARGNAKRLSNLCLYMSKLENRAYMILNNVPITCATVGSIMGWIMSVAIFMQTFI